jgi:hypothetical protein
MKNHSKLAACLMLLISLAMCLLLQKGYAEAAQPAYSISYSSERVEVGQTVTMTIKGQQVTNLYGMEIVFTYDTQRLQFIEKPSAQGIPDIIPNRDVFPAATSLEIAPKVDGNKILYAITKTGQVAPSNGNVTLMTLNFTAREQGDAVAKLLSVKLGAPGDTHLIWEDGVSSSLHITGKSVGDGSGPTMPQVAGVGDSDKNSNRIQLTPLLDQQMAKATLTEDQLRQLKSQVGSDLAAKKTIIIQTVNGVTVYALSLPSSFFQNGSQLKQVDIQTPLATVTVPWDMLKSSDLSQSDNVVLSIRFVDTSTWSNELKNSIGNNPVIDLNIEVDGQKLAWNNDKTPVAVSMAYKPTPEELLHPEHVNVWYIDDNGNVQRVPSGRYDAVTGRVSFQTTHFSKYAIVYEILSFTDIQNIAWAKKAIEVLASKGIVNGMTDTSFGPERSISRADFISLLVRTLELKADNSMSASFDDVIASDYFFNAVSIARSVGITDGANGNQFLPNEPISRQDLMVMTVRALQLANKIVPSGEAKVLDSFTDHADIADYANASVATLVAQGIVSGDGARLRPTSSMTRAEAAKLLYEMYVKILWK